MLAYGRDRARELVPLTQLCSIKLGGRSWIVGSQSNPNSIAQMYRFAACLGLKGQMIGSGGLTDRWIILSKEKRDKWNDFDKNEELGGD